MTVADVRNAFTSDQFPGTNRFWWLVAEVLSLAEEGVSRVRYELDHWANVAMAKSEQFDGH
jgi:hypothetical protein